MTKTETQPIEIGSISGCHGIQGWVKVFSHTDPVDNIFNYKQWILGSKHGSQLIKIKSGKVNGKRLIAQLEGINSRDEAEAVVGHTISIDALPKLAAEVFYWRDLEGLSVIDTTGQLLGVVDELLATNANDVLVILDAKQKRHLIPYTYGVHVQKVDLETGHIIVDWTLDYD